MPGESLKGFSKFFTNLKPGQRQELERAFADLQNSKEITSLDESLRLLKRKPDQSLPIPVLTVTETIRGAIIEWEALPDQRVNFYEADISTTSNFAAFSTVPTFGLSLVIDGLSQSKFVRVRGIRRDGTTTPYSDVATVSPNLFQVRTHVEENFYIRFTGYDEHTLLGGTGSALEYTPINPNGNSMVWGFITGYGSPSVGIIGDSSIKVFLKVTTTETTGEVTEERIAAVSLGEHFNSISLGPFAIAHPALGGTITIELVGSDLTINEAGGARSVDATIINWCHLNVIELGAAAVV